MNNQTLLSRTVCIIAVILTISGCASIRPETDPLLDKKALRFSKQAKSLNRHILASKGSGWAKLETKTRVEKFRIAWAAVFPDKVRITFLLSGLPIETIITNGEKITFFSHTGEHSKYSYNSKNPDMEKYIHVPVKMSELILLLLGRLPLKPFDDAYFSVADSSLSTLILKQKWKRTAQHLHFNNNGNVDELIFTDPGGKLLYQITPTKYKAYDFGDIPIKIEIQDTNERKLTLGITDFIANPPIKESVFLLTE
ncbi:hypothetical protein [Desulfobacula toluolica]|uniref:Conserved uncharacterized protein n=1 Tax=Desulfobacula toluolica (strain DSM 7467 / Tol2) TaxID=651182 RepID=K0NJG8_DESTT|nr:hypothetical protein [Desulfobacula toluolica]CCK80013.1 conserved uncharacterized protein [Desulfobacula toluolica Tol2]